ncbi:MAG: 4Fe-4S dicluster domain-containing protein [Thaumarchaeota archaeon]|nr:4Fe-4S dicluster domain-containing protein [Nitrososphaerota archaeon]
MSSNPMQGFGNTSPCQKWGMAVLIDQCLGCDACVAACTIENQTPFWEELWRTHVEDVEMGTYPDTQRIFVPRLCMQCENPPCYYVCPTGATQIVEGGIVVVDEYKCIGCQYCVEACPFGARYMYTYEDMQKAKSYYGENTIHVEPHVDKCTFCYETAPDGTNTPACVRSCVGGARVFGCLDNPDEKVTQLFETGQAVELNPELGVKAKVRYVLGKSLSEGEVDNF